MNAKLRLTLVIIAFLMVFPIREVFSQQAGGEIAEMDIVQVLTQLIPQPPGSSIAVVPGQNKLVVRNTPSNLKKIEQFIEDLGTPPQVAIEAKFVTVGENTFRDLGLEWSSLSFNFASPIGRSTRYSGLPPGQARDNPTTGVNDTAWSYDTITGSLTSGVTAPTGSPSGGLQLAYSSTNYPLLEAALHMLSTKTDTKFLSAPTVTTLNNEPAVIRFVTTVRYAQGVDVSTETDADTNTTTTTYDWDFVDRDIGIVLYVNPLVICPTQSVRLFLQPVVSEIDPTTDPYTISITNGQALTINMPRFTSRDATTNVDVHDGTTIVLGGLMNEETSELISKVPFLGDIPLIGKAFFQRKINSTERQHLLIFITVNVLDSQGNHFFVKG